MTDTNDIWEPDQQERFTELWELMKAYPDLPVIPMVDGEVVGDGGDGCDWMGAWGSTSVEEYLRCEDTTDRQTYDKVFFKSDDDVLETLEGYLSVSEYQALPESEEECLKIYNNLPWKKVIVVYIDKMR